MSRRKRIDDASLERLIRRGLVQKGMVIPQTEAEVMEFERSVDLKNIRLPDGLSDPRKCFEPRDEGSRPPVMLVQTGSSNSDEFEELLARAAREGRGIPRDVEDQMCADRKRAEDESDEGE